MNHPGINTQVSKLAIYDTTIPTVDTSMPIVTKGPRYRYSTTAARYMVF